MNTLFCRFAFLTILVLVLFRVDGQAQNFHDLKLSSYPGSRSGVNPGIATGSHSGFYIRIGEDMSKLCRDFGTSKDKPNFRLNVFATEGGFDGMKRLLYESEVQLAIIQSDLYEYAKLAADPDHVLAAPTESKRKRWSTLSDSIRLVTPLYTERIHIVAKNGGSGDDIKSLMDLFTKTPRARVNIGTVGSGIMITSLLLEQAIMSNEPSLPGWERKSFPTDYALEKLLNDVDDGPDELDAVILVGGVPFPALERFALKKSIIEGRKRLFRKENPKVIPVMKLVPFGEKADRILSSSRYSYFRPTEFKAGDYDFLTGSSEAIKTRGVTACLVTHKGYTDQSSSSHKMRWVQHIVHRMLTNLDKNNGLAPAFGYPRAGPDKWIEMSYILGDIQSNRVSWNAFGWQRHDDPKLKQMLDLWKTPQFQSPSGLIDPDDPIDPY